MCGAPVLPPDCLECPREDSNLHALRHRPSTCCVCQFRHAGKTARIIAGTSDLSMKPAATFAKMRRYTATTLFSSGKNCLTVPSTQPCSVSAERGQPRQAPAILIFKTPSVYDSILTEPP